MSLIRRTSGNFGLFRPLPYITLIIPTFFISSDSFDVVSPLLVGGLQTGAGTEASDGVGEAPGETTGSGTGERGTETPGMGAT